MIQLNRLEGFYWVARTGGYARAARAFPYPITQPAVHQQVKKLEGEIGVLLFERTGKDHVQLTAAGRALFDTVGPFLEGLPDVIRTLRDHDYGGRLRIHAAGLLLRQLLPRWLRRLQKARDDIRIELHEMEVPDFDLLRRGDADLLVDYIPEVPDDIETQTVAVARPFLVVPADHPAARRKKFGLSDLKNETFVSYTPGLLQYDQQVRVLTERGINPARSVSASSADTILGFVESGLGFSLIPSLSATGPTGSGFVARPLLRPKVEYQVVAAWRRSRATDPLLAAALAAAPSPGG